MRHQQKCLFVSWEGVPGTTEFEVDLADLDLRSRGIEDREPFVIPVRVGNPLGPLDLLVIEDWIVGFGLFVPAPSEDVEPAPLVTGRGFGMKRHDQ